MKTEFGSDYAVAERTQEAATHERAEDTTKKLW
jgi:hypothetical protein